MNWIYTKDQEPPLNQLVLAKNYNEEFEVLKFKNHKSGVFDTSLTMNFKYSCTELGKVRLLIDIEKWCLIEE